MHKLWLVIGGIAVPLASACGPAPNGMLHLELAVSGDRVAAAERVRERLAAVDERDDVTLGEVAVHEAPPDRLVVDVEVRAGQACQGFETAARAVREALMRPRQLTLREVLPLDDALLLAVRTALGDDSEVRREPGRPYLEVTAPASKDVDAALAALDTPTRHLGLEPIAVAGASAGAPARYQVWALSTRSELQPDDVADAHAGSDDVTNEPIVWVALSEAGTQRFEALTARLTGRYMAILVDDDVMSVPQVMEPIPGGRIQVRVGQGGQAPRELEAEAELLALGLAKGPVADSVRLAGESKPCRQQR